MPDLTPEQKEHLKMAHRAGMRIEETWSLFCMFLSKDIDPGDALRRANDAVAVWVEWMDQNEVEPPDIQRPSFTDEMSATMGKILQTLPLNLAQLKASFPAEHPEPEPQPTALDPTAASSQQEPTPKD